LIRFECDYAEGTHPLLLKRLVETNLEQAPGYGEDRYCESARAKIRALCGDNADVHFLVGGTQANLTVIGSVLRPWQGVLSPSAGHISTHEAGAIEATGHKVIVVPDVGGKLGAETVRDVILAHKNNPIQEHEVMPKLVYISFPTEGGMVYTKDELKALYSVCRETGTYLYIDGARMGYGLAACDMALRDVAENCDVFYIGGTKVGALFGEAVVIMNDNLKKDFRYMMKQRGGLLAKGRLLGIQFDALFTDGLYFKISEHAVDLAMKIKKAFAQRGFKFFYDSPTNQQFPIMPDEKLAALSEKYAFSFWERVDEKTSAVRFSTSWATREEDVLALIDDIKKL